MSTWKVEGMEEPCRCYQRACMQSLRIAQAQSHDVRVQYFGPKDNPNRLPNQSDFITHPDGTRDFRIDPTWWENHK